jgi:hypothetical protein
VAVFLRDPYFEAGARRRIDAWTGPSTELCNPKTLSALLFLSLFRASSAWIPTVVEHPEIVEALRRDERDYGDRIAGGWQERIRTIVDAALAK